MKEQKLPQQICQSKVTEPTVNSYKTPQTLGKAINIAAKKLPYLPRIKVAVVKDLAKGAGFKIDEKTAPKASGKAIYSELMEQVRNLFICPDIVYTMPGMKDEITFWEKGVKTKQWKYYLIMFLREAYEIYKQSSDYTNKVKFSKFCELRPRNVLLMKDSPKDKFKCIIHENFMNMLIDLSITYDSSKL